MLRIASVLAFVLLVGSTAAAQPARFIVRHAERADAGMAAPAGADPQLSAAGQERAAALARMLADARITAIFTTQYQRTQQTAAPLAKALKLEPQRIDSTDGATLAAKLKAATGNVLVVAHSNTIPEILKALGVSESVTVAEHEFDRLFVVVRGERPVMLALKYESRIP